MGIPPCSTWRPVGVAVLGKVPASCIINISKGFAPLTSCLTLILYSLFVAADEPCKFQVPTLKFYKFAKVRLKDENKHIIFFIVPLLGDIKVFAVKGGVVKNHC